MKERVFHEVIGRRERKNREKRRKGKNGGKGKTIKERYW
jgi:hypothetical protein